MLMLFCRIQSKSWQPCSDPSLINRKKSEQISADVKNDFSFKLNSFYGPTQFLKKNLQLVSNDVIWCLYSLSVLWGSLRKPTLKDRTEIWKSNPCCNMNVQSWESINQSIWYRSSPQQRPPKKSDSPSSCVRPFMKSLGRSTPCVSTVLSILADKSSVSTHWALGYGGWENLLTHFLFWPRLSWTCWKVNRTHCYEYAPEIRFI